MRARLALLLMVLLMTGCTVHVFENVKWPSPTTQPETMGRTDHFDSTMKRIP